MDNNYLASIIMGAKSDLDWAKQLSEGLGKWSIPTELGVASAHKNTYYALGKIEKYDSDTSLKRVLAIIAGKTDALSGTAAGNTCDPVIACPPDSAKYGGISKFSSMNAPRGVPSMTTFSPKAAAGSIGRIFAAGDVDFRNTAKRVLKKTYSEIIRDAKNPQSDNGWHVAIIIDESEASKEHAEKISRRLNETWRIPFEDYVVPQNGMVAHVLDAVKAYEQNPLTEFAAYIVAADDEAISDIISRRTIFPVISSQRYSEEKFNGQNIIAYLDRMQSSESMHALEPENAADAIGRIRALTDKKSRRTADYLVREANRIIVKDDEEVSGLRRV